MTRGTPPERILKLERALVLFALIGITGLAWLYLIDTADMEDMSGLWSWR
ncbi:MAG TPA: hypothetical protein VHJ19_12555 [Gammaproteobacteria bacterium]|nr:hypothetical protein [Gammaproteobacteria bacterium]